MVRDDSRLHGEGERSQGFKFGEIGDYLGLNLYTSKRKIFDGSQMEVIAGSSSVSVFISFHNNLILRPIQKSPLNTPRFLRKTNSPSHVIVTQESGDRGQLKQNKTGKTQERLKNIRFGKKVFDAAIDEPWGSKWYYIG